MTKIILATATAVVLSASQASAVGFLTRMSCASDYYAYCGQFEVGSKDLRVCMRRAGPKLSKPCLNALIADGEVSKAEVEKKRQEITASRSSGKSAPDAKPKAETVKQKRTAIAKSDADRAVPQPTPASRKKPERQPNDAPAADNLTLTQKTFVALKERDAKFVEDGAPAIKPPAKDPDKRHPETVADPGAPEVFASSAQEHLAPLKRKARKKSKNSHAHSGKKAKSRMAGQDGKRRSAIKSGPRKDRLAKD